MVTNNGLRERARPSGDPAACTFAPPRPNPSKASAAAAGTRTLATTGNGRRRRTRCRQSDHRSSGDTVSRVAGHNDLSRQTFSSYWLRAAQPHRDRTKASSVRIYVRNLKVYSSHVGIKRCAASCWAILLGRVGRLKELSCSRASQCQ